MKTKLSPKEEIIMNLLWEHGPMSVKEMIDYYDDPKPHFNTVSTFVRGLEARGLVFRRRPGVGGLLLRKVIRRAGPIDTAAVIF